MCLIVFCGAAQVTTTTVCMQDGTYSLTSVVEKRNSQTELLYRYATPLADRHAWPFIFKCSYVRLSQA
jgi:hypothetical protein